MYHDVFVAQRLDQHRAADLAREAELRRRAIDRGVVLVPERPVVDAVAQIGIWLMMPFTRSNGPAPRRVVAG